MHNPSIQPIATLRLISTLEDKDKGGFMAVPEKYLLIMSKFQGAVKSEDFTEVDSISLDDLKLASAHLVKDKGAAYYHVLQTKIAERELMASHQDSAKEPLIFISYDTRDIELVKIIDDIVQRVFNKQVATFIAKRDIEAGDDAFRKMLHENLAKCVAVIAVCTKRSVTSPWLWFESGAGFQKTGLIPVWCGVKPQEFKAPMTIFQGKSVQDKTEMNELLIKISGLTKIIVDVISVTDEELAKLVDITAVLDTITDRSESSRIEDKIEFPLPIPNDEKPVHYLFECNFPLLKPKSMGNILTAIDATRYFLKNFNGFKYPLIEGTIQDISDNASVLYKHSEQPYTNQIRQQILVKSDNFTLTHWTRAYFSQKNGPRLIRSREFIDEFARLFLFFIKLARHFKLSEIGLRIRLFGLGGGCLHVDGGTQKVLQSFVAPNEIEISQTISIDSADADFMELLMQVWEKFRTPDGRFPTFDEKDFSTFLQNICEP